MNLDTLLRMGEELNEADAQDEQRKWQAQLAFEQSLLAATFPKEIWEALMVSPYNAILYRDGGKKGVSIEVMVSGRPYWIIFTDDGAMIEYYDIDHSYYQCKLVTKDTDGKNTERLARFLAKCVRQTERSRDNQ